MFPLISVIVPVYKVEAYLNRCVNSIIQQTYSNLEIILVDDGSPDNCPRMCDEWSQKDSRIRVIHKANGGLSDARNAGLDIATGIYVSFIDSDDYISQDYIELLLQELLQSEADISICAIKTTSSISESASDIKNQRLIFLNSHEMIEEMLYDKGVSTSACSKLFKTELMKEIRFPLNKYSEDLFTMYKVFLKASKIVYLPRSMYFYYCRPNSITTETFNNKHMDTFEALYILEHAVIKNSPNLQAAFDAKLLAAFTNLIRMQPPKHYLYDNGLWEKVKKSRWNVIKNRRASKRVRGYALLLILGPAIASQVVRFYYELKWKNL